MLKKHKSITKRPMKTPTNNIYKRYYAVFHGDQPRSRWNHAHGNHKVSTGESFATFYNSPKFSAIAVDLGQGFSVAGTETPVKSYAEKDVLAIYAVLQAVGFNNDEVSHIIDEHMKKLTQPQ